MIIQPLGRLIFGMVIKDKDLLRYIGFCVKLMTGDIMEGYHNRKR